ncbi:MAG: hypothetical protein J7K53_13580 [Bacteroidales bacterium]|nr:hypothetical protein [Bacteroidales bacterium]
MKKSVLFIVITMLFAMYGCSKKSVDIDAEKAAIKKVLVSETSAYLKQDLVAVLDVFAQDEKTIYLSVGSQGYKEIIGFEDITKYFRKSSKSDWSAYTDYKVEKSNWNININGNNAMVYFNQTMKFNMDGEPMETHSKEIRFMEKIKGDWKIVMLAWIDMSFFEKGVEEKTF